MLSAVNAMLLDMLAAVSRKDYEDRRRRQLQGIQTAKDNGKYRGRQVNQKLHNNIAALLQAGKSYGAIVELLGCSRSTISIVRKKSKASG
jgi:DNA invertase Pin-like site-specific DNA recombinase